MLAKASSKAATCGALLVMIAALGCSGAKHQVRATGRRVARDVRATGGEGLAPHTVPGLAPTRALDEVLSSDEGKAWLSSLPHPKTVQLEGEMFVAADQRVRIQQTSRGWRFAEDPTDLYAQATPRQALQAWVRASQNHRWDVLIRLAPQRYRVGLTADSLRAAWTVGPGAKQRITTRDEVAAQIASPMFVDDDQARLPLAGEQAVYLEREGDRWVVVGVH